MRIYQEIYFKKHFLKVVNQQIIVKIPGEQFKCKSKNKQQTSFGISFSNITIAKAYSKKEFEAALLYFGQSALMGPIDKETEKGREVAVALANRSAVHFEMEQW